MPSTAARPRRLPGQVGPGALERNPETVGPGRRYVLIPHRPPAGPRDPGRPDLYPNGDPPPMTDTYSPLVVELSLRDRLRVLRQRAATACTRLETAGALHEPAARDLAGVVVDLLALLRDLAAEDARAGYDLPGPLPAELGHCGNCGGLRARAVRPVEVAPDTLGFDVVCQRCGEKRRVIP